MGIIRIAKLGGEESKINYRLKEIERVLSKSVGQTINLFNQELKLVSGDGDWIVIMSETPPVSLTTHQYISELSALQIEELLSAALEVQDAAAPVPWSEVKKRYGINGSVLKALRERSAQSRKADFTSAGSIVPF